MSILISETSRTIISNIFLFQYQDATAEEEGEFDEEEGEEDA